jgi:D-psicose/D-tagatose/L-ribulose 3-epimerase
LKFGAHAFVWIPDWTTEAGNQAIRAAAEMGFDFIEIPLLRPEGFDAAGHRAALTEAGIEATASVVLPQGAHMAHHPEAAARFLRAVLDRLEALGGTILCGCVAYSLGTFTGKPPTDQERDTVVETLSAIAADAKARGIALGFEVCNRYETYMFNTLASGAEAIHAVGSDNIFLHADTYHMNIEEEGFFEPLVATGELLGYVHMSESHRGLVGTGTVDWDEVFRGLAAISYDGPLVLESFAAINDDLRAATKLWRPPNQPPRVLASEGLEFLRKGASRAGLA